MPKHVNIRLHGKVQGVFFRMSAKERAEELAIMGFIRNDPDGTVYLEAEGDEEAVEKFVAWCSLGPRLAVVEAIVAEEGEWIGFKNFRKISSMF